jgi:hypothetical protein
VFREQKVIFWGSCQRHDRAQSPKNLLAHFISFFNNRGYANNEFWGWKHVFLFFSPSFTDDIAKHLNNSVGEINTMLQGPHAHLISLCIFQLSSIYILFFHFQFF